MHIYNDRISYKSGRIHNHITKGLDRRSYWLQFVDKLNATDSA